MTEAVKEHTRIGVVSIIGGLFVALSMTLFLIPAGVYSTGFTGLAQILTKLLEGTPLELGEGLWFFILNAPLLVVSYFMLGRNMMIHTLVSVASVTLFIRLLPQSQLLSDDPLLNAVFGGVLLAIGSGITIRYGASTGGFDIVALILAKFTNNSVGVYLFLMNMMIALAAGALFGWPTALYTIVFLYVTSKVIDEIYTNTQRQTLFIVTNHPDEVTKELHQHVFRGITLMPAIGTYSKVEKATLMMVAQRHEVREITRICKDADPSVWINILPTEDVEGTFRR
ncbi:MAG: YitT family protein [Exiguobacterium sp.]|uniref:YitT family protein n=1 Tax=Exiguobacterium profundum TaxID=307643 RepID=A0ABY8AXP6_9BACL|nr:MULTISPECIES: YitT family protein [Exiguobacterium]QPI67000.1 YitT family protein [Exiguobacterium sp. PBE]MBG0918365.1 YitT family protein [Exiguobacterium sp. SRB7LM]MBQ6459027.1 YitT family protein [Exiguobacterium sp.]MBR2078095.1 YitT family protein [Exiguobacterium sp.]MBR2758681.1 YitT family protein [Exiguobacterium sp.]